MWEISGETIIRARNVVKDTVRHRDGSMFEFLELIFVPNCGESIEATGRELLTRITYQLPSLSPNAPAEADPSAVLACLLYTSPSPRD